MIFEKGSIICFCTDLFLKNFEDYNERINKEFIKVKKGKIPQYLRKRVDIHENKPLNLIIGATSISSMNIDDMQEKFEKDKKTLLKRFEKEENEEEKENIKQEILTIEKAFENAKNHFKIPRSFIKFEYTVIDKIENEQIQKAINIYPKKSLLNLINELINEEFNVTLCGFLNFDKKIYSLTQGFELRKQLVFPKIGSAYINQIFFTIDDSPLGIKTLGFKEDNEIYKISIKMEFKTNDISNLSENYSVLTDLVNLFITEK